MKPDAPEEYRGQFRPIRTNVPEIDVCELMPLHARCADKFSLIRSITHTFSDHGGGSKRLMTGRIPATPTETVKWDPKPGRRTGGPFQTIQTSVPGFRMSELMPRMAARIHKTAVIRSFSSLNTGHTGGSVFALMSGDRRDTGNLRTPSLGCLLGRELSQPGSQVPDHVSFWNATWPYSGGDKQLDFALFLGSRFEPINIASKLAPDGIQLPASLTDADHRAREALREQLATRFQANRSSDATVASHGGSFQRVRGIMDNASLFDVSREPQHVRDRYGHSLFGQQALVARRLVEAGVPFVRLTDGWWDSHGENFEIHASKVPTLDRVMSALPDDLEQRGLMDDTLVITFAEMGRTP